MLTRPERRLADYGDGERAARAGVTYAIRPVGIDGAIVVTMTWAAPQYGECPAAMADAITRSVRVMRVMRP